MRKDKNLLQAGLLLLRVGIGVSIFFHGLPKMTGGPETWTAIGGTMSNLGINFAPAFWGFMAAFAETIGGDFVYPGTVFPPGSPPAYRHHDCGAGYALFAGRRLYEVRARVRLTDCFCSRLAHGPR